MPVQEAYRGHDIVVLDTEPRTAIIVERQTGAALPTKITALPDEAEAASIGRARRLIDVYLDAQAQPFRAPRRAATLVSPRP